MSPNDFFGQLARNSNTVNLPVGHLTLGEDDQRAARVIQFIKQDIHADERAATVSDILDVLDSARFWILYFAALRD